jgi:hypothetical protein
MQQRLHHSWVSHMHRKGFELPAILSVRQASFSSTHREATMVEDLVQTLVELELPVPDKPFILHKYLPLKLAHNTCCLSFVACRVRF